MQGLVIKILFRRRSVRCGSKFGEWNFLQQALGAPEFGVHVIGIDNIPGDVPGFDLGFYLRHAPIVDFGCDGDSGLLLKRFFHCRLDRRAQCPSPSHDDKIARPAPDLRASEWKLRQSLRIRPGCWASFP